MKKQYAKSLALELVSQANRVRDLIGDRHWLSDGFHKEHLFAELLRRHAPSSLTVSRGFVRDPETEFCSGEQDILLLDSRFSRPVFSQGDLVIAAPKQVLAAISVKTKLTKRTAIESLQSLGTVLRVFSRTPSAEPPALLSFHYFPSQHVQSMPARVYDYVANAIAQLQRDDMLGYIGTRVSQFHLATAEDFFFALAAIPSHKSLEIRGYACDGLASAVAVANLLDYVAAQLGGETDLTRQLH